ncbi:ATP-binding cassette domain-containing protein [Vibrio harveyi]|uniref:ATP-binding cassette domain-containing protein n=1 Tax=Vibrio harveyi TaxID=669 RepID=UPI000AD5D854|nr:ATP-binding cassette domain-containing protein [Vibrio harveyi]
MKDGNKVVEQNAAIHIEASDLVIFSPEGKQLVGPLTFSLDANQSTALVGPSGAGKTSLVNTILGFSIQGSLKVNGCELSELDLSTWRKAISWIGQNPMLYTAAFVTTSPWASKIFETNKSIQYSTTPHAAEFVEMHGLDYQILTAPVVYLLAGTASALARAMLQNGRFGYSMSQPPAWMLGARNCDEGIGKYTEPPLT